jgi:hypothetical protein
MTLRTCSEAWKHSMTKATRLVLTWFPELFLSSLPKRAVSNALMDRLSEFKAITESLRRSTSTSTSTHYRPAAPPQTPFTQEANALNQSVAQILNHVSRLAESSFISRPLASSTHLSHAPQFLPLALSSPPS